MRIAQIVSTYPPYRGGMGGVAFEYTERLRARGADVEVLTLENKDTQDIPEYVHHIHPLVSVGNAGIAPSLFRHLQEYDILHLHYPFFGGAEPVAIRKLFGRQRALLLTYHMDAVGEGLRGLIFKIHSKIVLPWIIKAVDRVLVTSMDYAQTSELRHIKSVFQKTEVHPLGVDLARFHPGSEPEMKHLLGIAPEVPVLVFVGGLDTAHHFKGLPVLIKALQHIRDAPWHLIVVGEGNLKQSFVELATSAQLSDRTHFLGEVDDATLPKCYRTADIHVFPSTERAEAFGLVALEAAASGIPSIASDLPGVRTVVQNNSTGILVPPSDSLKLSSAILTLLEEKSLRTKLGKSARKNAELQYNWEDIISNLMICYQSTLAAVRKKFSIS